MCSITNRNLMPPFHQKMMQKNRMARRKMYMIIVALTAKVTILLAPAPILGISGLSLEIAQLSWKVSQSKSICKIVKVSVNSFLFHYTYFKIFFTGIAAITLMTHPILNSLNPASSATSCEKPLVWGDQKFRSIFTKWESLGTLPVG